MALHAENIGTADYLYWYFNYVFAGTTATIVSGAVAERCQFRAYLCYSFALAGFIYPVCSHWSTCENEEYEPYGRHWLHCRIPSS